MKNTSRQQSLVILAFIKGYTVNKNGDAMSPRGKMLSTNNSAPGGYPSFGIRIGPTPTRVFVHRLQAYIKYGSKAFDKDVVTRHLDGNPLNNSWDNIAIGSQLDNMRDKPKEQRIRDASHPIHDHHSILSDFEDGYSYQDLIEKYNIPLSALAYICTRSLAFRNKKGRRHS